MKQLLLLRHADALSYSSSLQDIDRELSQLGHEQADKISSYIDKKFFHIDKAIISSAMRTKQTSNYIKNIAQFEYSKLLYDANISDLISLISSQASFVKTLMIIGHNPTISFLATNLSNQDLINMPTAGLVFIRLDIDEWSKIAEGELNPSYSEKIFLE